MRSYIDFDSEGMATMDVAAQLIECAIDSAFELFDRDSTDYYNELETLSERVTAYMEESITA